MTESEEAPSVTGRRRLVIGTVVALYLGVQILVPVVVQPGPDSRQFGWQMFSVVGDHVFKVVGRNGSVQKIDPVDYLVSYRSDVDYSRLPQHLCERIPGTVQVVVKRTVLDTSTIYPCSP